MMIPRSGWVALGLGGLVLAAALAWRFAAPAQDALAMPAIDPGNPEQVALGKDIYVLQCAACHGVRLQGQANWRDRLPNGRLPAPPHDATGHTWHHPDEQLFAITKQGVEPFAPKGYESDMPGFGEVLSDAEIAATLAYIKSRWPREIRQRHDALNRAKTK